MGATHKLPEELRAKLAKPMGKLFKKPEIENPAFLEAIKATKTLVSVGDRVTETLGEMGRIPDIQIVDSLENRKHRAPPDVPFARLIAVKNPPGTLTDEAIDGVKDAFEGTMPARILVSGEEDLMAIPAVAFAPLTTRVFYGQPGVGIVMVTVTTASRARNRAILVRMGAEKAV